MIRLKNRNVRLRMARRMRILVSVQVLLRWDSTAIFSLVPQPAAGQLDENILERRRKHFQALQFVILGFQLLHQRDDGLRRPRGMQDVGAVEFAAIGDAFERAERAVGQTAAPGGLRCAWFRRSDVSARAACRSR